MQEPDLLFKQITSARLPSPPWKEIGRGVWGRVFDLGDGTVLKLVRHRGGIGDGAEIFFGEVKALDLANGLSRGSNSTSLLRIETARLVGFGQIDDGNVGLEEYCGWLRMTHLEGRTASAALDANADDAERHTIMQKLGEATARFHQESPTHARADAPLPAVSQARLAQIADMLPQMTGACDDVAAILATGPQHPFLHGDINGGNALLAADGGIGLIDLGEAQTGPVELDLRHAHDIGGPGDAMLHAYEEEAGAPLDQSRLAAAFALNALGTLAIAQLGTVDGLNPQTARAKAEVALKAIPRL